MHALALSTVLFQAIATVALVVGVALSALFPPRLRSRTRTLQQHPQP
jgi:hypothetical protein